MVSKLHTEGRYIKDEYGKEVVLRGVHKHGWEDHPYSHWIDRDGNIHYETWDAQIVADNLDAIKRWGGNCIRVHDTAQFWIENTLNHRQILKDFISMANERGIYVILTFYHVLPTTGQTPIPYPPYSLDGESTVIPNEQAFIDMWVNIATELKQYPNVLFDLWNEPTGDETARESWFNVVAECIRRIREVSDAIILVHWGYDLWCNMNYPDAYFGLQKWADDPRLEGVNVVYSAHIYGDFHYSEEAYRKASTYDEVKLAFDYVGIPWLLETLNKPLLIGEIACLDLADIDMLNQFNNELTILNEYGASWMAFWWWSIGPHRLLDIGPNYPPNSAGLIVQKAMQAGVIRTPYVGELPEGNYIVTMPSKVTIETETYEFSHWEDGSTNPVRTINLTSDRTITATYAAPPVEYTLTISTTTGGTTNPAPGSYRYTAGTSVTVTAIPDTSYRFVHWELDTTVRTENPITITIDRDYSLKAVFEYVPPPPLTATIRGIVKDAETTQPITGAVVTCNGYADVTEIDGSYEFVDIPAKSYVLTATKENYVTASLPIDASAGGTFTQDIELSPTPKIPPKIPPKIKVTGPLGIWTFPLLTRLAETFPSLATLLERLKSTQTAS